MLKDMTLGQFFPGKSIVHRLDARVKILLTILYIVAIFMAENEFCFALLLASAVLLVLLSRLSLGVIVKGLKPVFFVLLFTMALNLFLTKGEVLIFKFYFIEMYYEGVVRAVKMALRVVVLIVGTSVLLTYTTSPIVLTDAIESLLSPLKKIRVPVHDFAMMMTIALRFIPTLVEETEKIINAQKSRGADFESGGLLKRARALVPVLIPLFVSSFNRADELAVAMECRCYRGDVGRTRYVKMKMHVRDVLALLLLGAFGAAVLLGNRYFPAYLPM